jgi:hypothetical protein
LQYDKHLPKEERHRRFSDLLNMLAKEKVDPEGKEK